VSPRDPARAGAGRPATPHHPAHPAPGPRPPADPDLAAALAGVRAAFGPIEILAVHPHQPDPDQQRHHPGVVQGRLALDRDREVAG
jgi:hypothetical protein